MAVPLLDDVVLIFALSVVVIYVLSRLRLPGIVGFFVTGVVVGPYGLGLVEGVEAVEVLAEIGVVLLLFTIGLELSLESLVRWRRMILVGGNLQVLITFLGAAGLSVWVGFPVGEAVLVGFLVALSSTAVVMKLLQDRGDMDTPHGRSALSILIHQDIVAVPMMLVIPFLGTGGGGGLFLSLVEGVVVVLVVVVAGRWVVPWILDRVVEVESQEIFLIALVVIGLGAAWIFAEAGLDLALGAFLAGLVVSESEYSHHAFGQVLPLRDVFASFFFVSLGMLLNAGFVLNNLSLVVGLAAVVLVAKAVIVVLVVSLGLGLSLRAAVIAGLSLGQIGEFSFILAERSRSYGLLSGDVFDVFLSVAVLTMAATPFVLDAAPGLADRVSRLPLPRRVVRGGIPDREGDERRDHVVVVGFGLNGRNVAQAAEASGIQYAVVEMNPVTVREARSRGVPIIYGDASSVEVLEAAGVDVARVVVVAIGDAAATRRVVSAAKRLNPVIHVVARTRYVSEVEPLYGLGAEEVIPEEFETSVEIFSRVLSKYLVPRERIEEIVGDIRAEGYGMFRGLERRPVSFGGLDLPGVEVSAVEVGEAVGGETLEGLDLGRRLGVTVVGIKRGGEVVSVPSGGFEFLEGDVVYLLGDAEGTAEAAKVLRGDV